MASDVFDGSPCISLDQYTFNDPARILNLIRDSSFLSTSFSNYCEKNKVVDPGLDDICAWAGKYGHNIEIWYPGREEDDSVLRSDEPGMIETAVASILVYVIKESGELPEWVELYNFAYILCARDELDSYGEWFPWQIHESKKTLSAEKLFSVLTAYVEKAADGLKEESEEESQDQGEESGDTDAAGDDDKDEDDELGEDDEPEYSHTFDGVGIRMEEARVTDPNRVVDLIRLVPDLYQAFVEYCEAHEIKTPVMHDFSGWVGCAEDDFALATILCIVISEKENVFFHPDGVFYGDEMFTLVLFSTQSLLDYTEEEKSLSSSEACRNLLMKYVSIISDETPFFQNWDFDGDGLEYFPLKEK